jgi:outer membrane protein assembly factor BamB
MGSLNYIYAVDADTGTGLWSYFAGPYADASPAVTNGAMYVGCVDGICAFGL